MQHQPIKIAEDAFPCDNSEVEQRDILEQKQPESSGPVAHKSPSLHTGWEVVVGQIVGWAGSAEALIEIPRINSAAVVKARTVVSLNESEVGQQVVLAFEDGDLTKPIILGLIKTAENVARKMTVEADGDKFVLVAEREIELRCGEASITLTRAGKVLIKGEYVLTRAKGINRIKGAAVSIN